MEIADLFQNPRKVQRTHPFSRITSNTYGSGEFKKSKGPPPQGQGGPPPQQGPYPKPGPYIVPVPDIGPGPYPGPGPTPAPGPGGVTVPPPGGWPPGMDPGSLSRTFRYR